MSEILAIAVSHHRAGRFAQAEAIYREILSTNPQHADALHLLGLARHQLGQPEEAARYITAAIELAPSEACYHSNLGRVYRALQRRDAEMAAYHRALDLDPNLVAAHLHMALALEETGHLDEAQQHLRQALRIKPDYAEAHFNLGLLLERQGAVDDAVAAYEQAARCSPRPAAAHFNRGNALRQQQKLEQAAHAYQDAVAAEPDWPDARLNLGQMWGELGRFQESLDCLRELLAIAPRMAEAHDGLGATWLCCADAPAARAEYLRAVELRPEWAAAHSRALGCEQYLPDASEAGLAASHAEWDRRHAAPLRSTWQPHANERDPGRRLRWGLVAPEFGENPIGYLLIRTLEALDPDQTEVYCYADRTDPGPLTTRFLRAARVWRDTGGTTDADLAEQVRNDRIDVLFDLAGHTAHNRLLAFARKPAPLQIAWFAYPGTTGMEAMDYLLADRYHVPAGSERHYRERVLRLPDGYACYDPPADSPSVAGLPAAASGYVTFGSFNNPLKISAAATAAWGAILRRVPGARLRLKYFGLDNEIPRRQVLGLLADQAIAAERIHIEGGSPRTELLAAYQHVDLALDTMPYSGGLTTCEALWMGVPVITCPGATFASRHSASHLSSAGLAAWVANSPEQYIERAVALASDLGRLAELRAGLRDRLVSSPLCDGRRFAQNLERSIRDAWGRWLNGMS